MRRARRARAEVEAVAVAALRRRWEIGDRSALDALAEAVAAGESDPYAAADALLER